LRPAAASALTSAESAYHGDFSPSTFTSLTTSSSISFFSVARCSGMGHIGHVQ